MNAGDRTRRDFLKTTALAGASVLLLGALASCERTAEPGRKIGFALAGLGNLSVNRLAPALQRTRRCRLAGVVTGSSAKAAQWKAQYNIPDKNIYSYDTMQLLTGWRRRFRMCMTLK